ncbi:hypothetical protein [Labilibaculum euxinus]
MNLPILINTNCELDEFIKFWSKLYSYHLESLYNDRIQKMEYTLDDLQQLFIWKNGMNLSFQKQNSLEKKVLAKLEIINKLKTKQDFELIEFEQNFNNLTAVWKIFLLHIIRPDRYPIYDQHINRAFNFIHRLDYKNISADSITNKSKELFYFNTYLSFIHSLDNCNLKTLDEAFFAFGQFINTKTYAQMVK